MVNINFGRSKSKIVIFTKIIFAIELEFAKSAKFTARENFALYGTKTVMSHYSKKIYIIENLLKIKPGNSKINNSLGGRKDSLSYKNQQ